jgi:hypothetical protein
MKTVIISLCALAMIFAVSVAGGDEKSPAAAITTQPPDGVEMRLFLLIGQSNMAGRGKIEPQDLVVHPRVWKLTKDDTWAPGVDPLHFDKPKVAGVGLGTSFAKAIADADPDAQIGLVPCAVGGTSIDQWKKGDKLYDDAVRRTKIAMKHGKVAGILWHQGESDSGTAEKRAAYPAKLEHLIADLRADLAAPDVPFVLGQLGPFHASKNPGSAAMSQLLLDFPKTHHNTACAKADGLTDQGDQTHFDNKSLRELGKRYAEAYQSLKKRP